MNLKRGLPLISAPLIVCALLTAQQLKTPLKVTAVQGDGAFNDIRKGLAQTPVVEVRDENGRPVSNARVVFTLPASGPGGSFMDDHKEYITTTDQQGRATARGLKPNQTEGRFPIRVRASLAGREGTATVWQSNTLAGGEMARSGGSRKKLIIIGLLGAAAAGGVIAATRGGGGGSTAAAAMPTSLSAGAITVGGPR